ncbi:type I-F CRISPR-associated protein Csy1 [Nitrosospira sp. Is2]|uniref:type I-F CRISPR-associated protein Csy1 n=1 Tax=Nitrosospira sp. Is2 TaxID=3080532 RepID=UPI00295553B9|nr:type I-F CRISPR-associated protein Csy1 [Nitrosospira sp. Is2]WON73663.1 type I-F CRISPR-associated protein Csy1 [Nitrosospira sp. Is2]
MIQPVKDSVLAKSSVVPTDARSARFEAAIRGFLHKRLQLKLDVLQKQRAKLKDSQADKVREIEHKRKKEIARHQLEEWIADAARRASRIEQATHILKLTHPQAKGSNLLALGNKAIGETYVGTHTIGRDDLRLDVIGDAAALDVAAFLRVRVDGKSLLDYANSQDPALAAAFCEDRPQAEKWMEAFGRLAQPRGPLSSHKFAKQVYWPVTDGSKAKYHLLAPLFSTSIAHYVWKIIEEDRFSVDAQNARAARRAGAAYPHGYRTYPDLAIQRVGGANPQNAGQLNLERNGKNYLLPSLPPTWRSERAHPPLHVNSIFDHLFSNRNRVRRALRAVHQLGDGGVAADSGPAGHIRIGVARELRDELLQFAAELHELKAGWTLDPDCQLNSEEQCWLDPRRAAQDESFAALCRANGWQDTICARYANWLNVRLGIPAALRNQTEAAHWASFLDKELHMTRIELSCHD